MQFSRLGSSRMVVPLPSSRCLAEGNRIFYQNLPHSYEVLPHCTKFYLVLLKCYRILLNSTLSRTPPPPCRSPLLVVPLGGGGASLGQPKIFRCGSLCCCVGGCVVGHYHLHPLHSWQDILLTFAEMGLDNTTMFPLGTSVMFIRSTGEPVLAQIVAGRVLPHAASVHTARVAPNNFSDSDFRFRFCDFFHR